MARSLPVVEYGTCAGVRVPEPAEPRRLFDRVRPSRATPEHTEFEGALAGVHRQATRAGDDVVIVGGGYGITTVVAARQGASVTVFEPTAQRRELLRRTLAINDIDDAADVTLRDAVVGDLAPAEADEKNLSAESLSQVSPAVLPACDVLELDCEGAELSILQGLETAALPRVVAVEVHPIKLDGRADEVVPLLTGLGYDIEQYRTHDGIALSESAFRDLCAGTTPDVGDPDHQAFPPVVHAVRTGDGASESSTESAEAA